MHLSRLARLCALVLSLSVSSLFGQFEGATVLEAIRDSSDAVIPKSKVTLVNANTEVSVANITDLLVKEPIEFLNQNGTIRPLPCPFSERKMFARIGCWFSTFRIPRKSPVPKGIDTDHSPGSVCAASLSFTGISI